MVLLVSPCHVCHCFCDLHFFGVACAAVLYTMLGPWELHVNACGLAGRRVALSNVRVVIGGSMMRLVIAVVACLLPVLCRGVRCSASRYTGIRMRVGCLVLWQGNWSCLLFATGVGTAITAIATLLPVVTDYHCHEGYYFHYHDHYCHWCRW